MKEPHRSEGPEASRVSLVAIPEAVISTLSGLYDVLNSLARPGYDTSPGASQHPPLRVEVVGEQTGPLDLASGMPIHVQRRIDEIDVTDVVIVPSVLLPEGGWPLGRRSRVVDWMRAMHERGALLCSACSGVYLIAETGLLNGLDVTVHYGYAQDFAALYPAVAVHPEQALVVAGAREEIVSSGASTSWHDLAIYLISRFAGATAAQAVVRFFALQWHQDGLAPYIVFDGRKDHGDKAVLAAQQWLGTHFPAANPVEEMIKRSTLAERTFKRRFAQATGLSPIVYVQRLRIDEAKRRLERTAAAVDDIGWQVGYEDPAFFRRLFKRTTGVTPSVYRRRYRVPEAGRSAMVKVSR
jgi:transcriptional regulator GlxA family with amidase domain